MRIILAAAAILSSLALLPHEASAQGRRGGYHAETTGALGGERAPWNRQWEYDSGSDNDRRPELPYYQQGRGQQTGGPSRNLLPGDGFTISPR